MKRLNEYILEKQEEQINEDLFGDIIRTFLGWVGGSVAWAANWFKEGVHELWGTFKNTNEKLWERAWLQYNERNKMGNKITPPKNEKELAKVLTQITEKGTIKEKVETLEELYKAFIDAGMDKKATLKLFVEQTYLVAKAAIDSDSSKISEDDKEYAKSVLANLKKKYPKEYADAKKRVKKYDK